MNDRICVLHVEKPYDKSLRVIPFTEETLKKCHKMKEVRDLNQKKSMYSAVILPIAVDEKMGYHSHCYRYFNSGPSKIKIKETSAR